jgi:RNA polymerase sigma factor (sigma-70 family)
VTAQRAAAIEQSSADAAIATFVAEHYDRLLRVARLVCRDAADAADAVQLGLEQAWRHRASLRDDERLWPWLHRIVVREAIRVSKRRRSWLGRLFSPQPDVKWIEPPDRRAPEPATLAALRAAFAKLSPEQRAVVSLHLYAGYTIVETAAMVGAPAETVRSRLRHARGRLRAELEGPSR